ncbi:hypothetical protein [Novosphingobium rosa]|uniref:hypothetical protein n=1 Tax=Novosphingobium rosa TaxID=76978 RepID=UPI0012ECF71A|nr:hypothetical protein [Novosphingobium rosa]
MISSAMGRLWAFAYRSARVAGAAARISEGEMHGVTESCAGACPEKISFASAAMTLGKAFGFMQLPGNEAACGFAA